MTKEINKNQVLSFLNILRKWRNYLTFIMIFTIFVGIATVFLLPKWYKSEVVFMAKSTGSSNFFLKSFNINPMGDDLFTINLSESDFEDLIFSKKILDLYYKKFNIAKRYKIKYIEDYYDTFVEKNLILEQNAVSGLGMSDILSYKVSVIDKNKETAKEGAEFIVNEFSKMLENFYNNENKKRIEVLSQIKEKYLKQYKAVEDSMLSAIKKTGILPLDYNSQLLNNIDTIKEELIKLEIEREIKAREFSENSNIVSQIDKKN